MGKRRHDHMICVALALGAITGCVRLPPAVTLEPPQQPWTAKNYQRALDRWTRNHAITVVEELNTTLRVHATLFSPEFNTAYLDKRSRLFRLPERERRELEKRLSRLWEESYPFVMVAATHDIRWNDFARRKSQWRLWLANNRGERVAPLEIKQKRPISETEVSLFPHLDMFYQFYQLRFPKRLPDGRPLVRKDTNRLILLVTGPLGTATMIWRLQ